METVDPAWYAAEAERVRKAGVDLDHAAALHSRASDAFLHSATAVSDPHTKQAVLLISHTHALKAENIRTLLQRPASRVPPARVEASPELAGLAFDAEEPPSRAASSVSAVEEMLELERCLVAIGLGGAHRAGGGAYDETTGNGQHLLSSTLGESWSALGESILSGSRLHAATKHARNPTLARAGAVPSRAERAGGPRCGAPPPQPRCESAAKSGEMIARDEEVMRLLQSMKTLGEENAALLQENQALRHSNRENARAREDIDEFKQRFQEKFGALRAALVDFRDRYPGDANPANALLSPSAVLPPASDGTTSRESQLESALRQLELNLATAREENRRKDLMITRYETWYRTLKANARKRSSSDENNKATTSRLPGAAAVPD